MTKKPPHVLALKKTFRVLSTLVPPEWHVTRDDPINTLDGVPEPDVTVLRGGMEAYQDRTPDPADVVLVVEVGDSSLQADQTLMKRSYARAGIPVYWIVNIPDRRLEVYADPTRQAEAHDYRRCGLLGPDEQVPLVLEGREIARIAVRDLLP